MDENALRENLTYTSTNISAHTTDLIILTTYHIFDRVDGESPGNKNIGLAISTTI